MLPLSELEAAADRDEASAVRALHPVMDPAQRATALRIGRDRPRRASSILPRALPGRPNPTGKEPEP